MLWGIFLYVRLKTGFQYPFAVDCGLAGFLWFLLGFEFRRFRSGVTIPRMSWLAIVPVSGYLCWQNYLAYGQPNYIAANLNGAYGVLGTALGLVAFFGFCKLLDVCKVAFIVKVSKASIVVMCLHMYVMRVVQAATHYQGGTIGTLLGDCLIVAVLTLLYPLIKKYIPALTGNR